MKKIGIFLDEIKDKNIDKKQKFSKLGFNTGNMLFWHSLKTQLDLDIKSRWYIDHIDQLDLNEYKAFVTTDLIWIRQMQDFSYLNKTLDVIGDLPLIPISIGLQCNNYDYNFKLHPETVKVLKRIERRCIMGVRGKYTAEILTKHGITNFKVIGCPSMYMNAPGLMSVSNNGEPKKVSMNFETFYMGLDEKRVELLTYGAKSNFAFIEQAEAELTNEHIKDTSKLNVIRNWLSKESKCFFDISEWREYLSKWDFSIGARFHGNVLAVWEGKPALFITCDSRTQELCEHFSLPFIDIKDFDSSKPIKYYYELADYSAFHRNYSKRVEEWKDFLKMNELMDSKNMVLYHCFTAYQFLELLIHKQLYHKDDHTVLFVPGDFKNLNPFLDDFIKNNFFDNVIFINPNYGFNENIEEAEINIIEYYEKIFKENDLNYLSFNKVYAAGAYRNFGVYASLMKKNFSIFEDASGTLTSENQYKFDKNNNPKMAEVINKYGLYYGEGDYIEKIYCVLDNQKETIKDEVKTKIINFKITDNFKRLDVATQKLILSIYNCPISKGEDITVIFTQWFTYNNEICKDERIVLHYQYLCDIFAGAEKIMLKTHPADPLCYIGHFSDCIVPTSKFPSELIECCGFNVNKVISLNSTANNAFSHAQSIRIEMPPFSPLDIYNKLIVMGEILNLFPNHEVKCYGISEKFVESIYKNSFNINKSVIWNMPIQKPKNSILIIDYLNWGKGTKIEELPSIINNMPYDSMYVFLNRKEEQFESIKLCKIFDYAIPISIHHEYIKYNSLYKELSDEEVWIFTRNEEYREILREFKFDKILKQVGIKLSVSKLTKAREKEIKLEKRVNVILNILEKLEESK